MKKIEIDCRSGNLLTNLIHYYDFIFALTKKKLTYFNNFETTSKLSINILLMLKKLHNKKLMIT